MNEPKATKRAFAPMLWTNFFFGMGVLDLQPNIFNKICEYVYTASFLILFNAIIISLVISSELFISFKLLKKDEIMLSLSFFSYVAMLNVVIIINRINSQKLRRVLRFIESFDQKMQDIGLANGHQALIVYQIKIISIYVFFLLLYFTVMYNNIFRKSVTISIAKKLYLTVVQIVLWFSFSISIVSFCIWVKYFRTKFQQMNEMVRGMLTTKADSPEHERGFGMQYNFKNKRFTEVRSERVHRSNESAHVIRELRQRHLELTKIAETVNDLHGIQILLVVSLSCVFIICDLYEGYKIIWMNLELDILLSKTIPIAWYTILHFLEMMYLNHVCAETCAEATMIGDIICELHEPSASKEFRTEIEDFILQLTQNSLVFTAYRFFDLGYSFIQEIVGSITTSLIILIQVGDMSIELTGTMKNSSTKSGTSPMIFNLTNR